MLLEVGKGKEASRYRLQPDGCTRRLEARNGKVLGLDRDSSCASHCLLPWYFLAPIPWRGEGLNPDGLEMEDGRFSRTSFFLLFAANSRAFCRSCRCLLDALPLDRRRLCVVVVSWPELYCPALTSNALLVLESDLLSLELELPSPSSPSSLAGSFSCCFWVC